MTRLSLSCESVTDTAEPGGDAAIALLTRLSTSPAKSTGRMATRIFGAHPCIREIDRHRPGGTQDDRAVHTAEKLGDQLVAGRRGRSLLSLDARQRQQVGGEVRQAVERALRCRDLLLEGARVTSREVGELQLRAQHRDGRAQLVTGIRDHLAFAVRGCPHRRDEVVEGLGKRRQLIANRTDGQGVGGRRMRKPARLFAHPRDRPQERDR